MGFFFDKRSYQEIMKERGDFYSATRRDIEICEDEARTARRIKEIPLYVLMG